MLAAANPHYGRYNVRKTISENINLPVALLSRFDLLFLLRDIANHDLDLQLAIHVCSVHQFLKIPDRQPGESKVAEPKALKEHIAQARKVQPVVPQELTECVASYTARATIAWLDHAALHVVLLEFSINLTCCRYIVGAYVNMRAEEAGALASGADPGAQVLHPSCLNEFVLKLCFFLICFETLGFVSDSSAAVVHDSPNAAINPALEVKQLHGSNVLFIVR